jgi:pyruvate dehydrogenase E2 component (dihydrolipoamide acetyltransferase)
MTNFCYRRTPLAKILEVTVPDIGNFASVAVIEVNVKPGDNVNVDDTLITLESDKAAMDIPSPYSGKVEAIKVKVGDKVAKGALILTLAAEGEVKEEKKPETKSEEPKKAPEEKIEVKAETKVELAPVATSTAALLTSPAVRRLARELDIDLQNVPASGEKGRITLEDVKSFLQRGNSSGGAGLPSMPVVDFTQWGNVTTQPLSRIQKISAAALHRNWVNIPHVTQFDSVDITEMEEFRQANKATAEKASTKLTPLVFLMKAAVAALRAYPTFNASLAADGQQIILKQYYHIGVAVDTPNGLVVPVIRDVDKKGLLQLATELGEISAKARAGKLTAEQMQGSCFSISSLGGIGGTAFTPIINAPDVAILGVSKSQMQPIYQDGEFVARLMLPLSLSYDHRVIDGALAAKFIVTFGEYLQDVRRLLL